MEKRSNEYVDPRDDGWDHATTVNSKPGGGGGDDVTGRELTVVRAHARRRGGELVAGRTPISSRTSGPTDASRRLRLISSRRSSAPAIVTSVASRTRVPHFVAARTASASPRPRWLAAADRIPPGSPRPTTTTAADMPVKVKWKTVCAAVLALAVQLAAGMFEQRHCNHPYPKPHEVSVPSGFVTAVTSRGVRNRFSAERPTRQVNCVFVKRPRRTVDRLKSQRRVRAC